MKKLLSIALCLALVVCFMAVTVSAAGTYYVAGVEALCGSNWNPSDPANQMSDADGDGVYSITYKNVPAGSYQFKVTDGTWDNCWPGSNYELTLASACDVTINFNTANNEVTVDAAAQDANPGLEVNSVSIIGTGIDALGNWDTDLALTKVSDGVYEYTMDNVPAGTSLEFKFRINNDWSVNFGGATSDVVSGVASEGVRDGQNIKLTTTEDSKITMRLDLTAYDHTAKTGATYTVTVAPVGSTESTEATEAPTEAPTQAPTQKPDTSNPKDGDSISIFVALMAVSAVGIAVIGKKKFF